MVSFGTEVEVPPEEVNLFREDPIEGREEEAAEEAGGEEVAGEIGEFGEREEGGDV